MPDRPRERVDLRPDLSITVIIACGALSKSSRALEERHATPVRRDPQRPRGAGFVDRRSGGKLNGPRTAASGLADNGERIGSGNPIGVHDPVSTSRRAPPAMGMRASVRTPNARSMFCGPNSMAMSPALEIETIRALFQLEIAHIGAFRATEECGVGLPLPARAVDEALTIRGESGR